MDRYGFYKSAYEIMVGVLVGMVLVGLPIVLAVWRGAL